MAHLKYLRNVTTLTLDEELCTGCGVCLKVCPHAVLGPVKGSVEILSQDDCMECGACSMNCPTDAITVQAGVGCAAKVILSAFDKESTACRC